MAFHIKTDYCGLIAATTPSGSSSVQCLVIRDDQENASTEVYQPNGDDGGFVGTEVYGEDSAPSNAYGLKVKITASEGSIKLGKIVSITDSSVSPSVTKKYALEKISISTGSAQIVTLSASSQEVESDCDSATMPYFAVPAFVLEKANIPQDIFSALSLTGSGCQFSKIDYEISCVVQKDKVEGVKISSDVNSGIITMSGTILQTGSTKPTLTIDSDNEDGWVITQKPNCKNMEARYKEYDFEAQLVLEKTRPVVNAVT